MPLTIITFHLWLEYSVTATHLLHKKMKTSVMISGVCCLLALSFTLSECDEHINCTSIDSDLQDCIDEFTDSRKNTDILCEGDCRSTLEDYADDCLGLLAESYKAALDEVCKIGAVNCEDTGDPTSELGKCNDDFTADPENVCDDCRSALEEYADACLDAAAEGFKDRLDEACGAGATVEAAALSTSSSACHGCSFQLKMQHT